MLLVPSSDGYSIDSLKQMIVYVQETCLLLPNDVCWTQSHERVTKQSAERLQSTTGNRYYHPAFITRPSTRRRLQDEAYRYLGHEARMSHAELFYKYQVQVSTVIKIPAESYLCFCRVAPDHFPTLLHHSQPLLNIGIPSGRYRI